MRTLRLPATTSELINVLLHVLTSPHVGFETVMLVGQLITLDAKCNHTFLMRVKQTGSDEDVEAALELFERIHESVHAAWKKYDVEGSVAEGAMRQALGSAIESHEQWLSSITR